MPYNPDLPRPHKNGARSVAVIAEPEVNPTPAKAAIFLPGKYLLDIEEALANGTIDRNTYLIVVERDNKLADEIRRQVRKFGFTRCVTHVGRLETMHIPDYLPAGLRLDFAYLDVCNQVTPELVRWVGRSIPYFSKQAVLAITLSMQRRGGRLLEELLKRGCQKHVCRFLPPSRTSLLLSSKLRDAGLASVFAVLNEIVRQRGATVLDCLQYCDTSPMTLLRLRLEGRRGRHVAFNARVLDDAVLATCQRSNAPERRQRALEGISQAPAWRQLQCPAKMSAGEKAKYVRMARQGQHPYFLNPAQWAWCPLNQNGRRPEPVVAG